MNKARLLAVAGVMLMAACLSAGALTLHDSDGFIYTTYGEGIYGSVYYYPIHVTGNSAGLPAINEEGLLFYNATLNAVSIIVFESNTVYGWSLEGHWAGNGCTFYGVNTNNRLFDVKLYLD